jgi:hypothetical protein
MDETVDVSIPVDLEAAKALADPARRRAAGRYLSGLLKGEDIHDVLTQAIADAKQEARVNGLTDDDVEAELAAWRAGRPA